jgi:hypothetical protein
MAFKTGKNAAVKLGTSTVVGMGTWRLEGIAVDLLDSTAFGDTAKSFLTGLLDYGNVSFSGLYDPADTTGQDVLRSANKNASKITNIRLYVDNTSYWTPDVTTLPAAGMWVTSYNVGFDKNGLGTTEFTGKCTGPWALV